MTVQAERGPAEALALTIRPVTDVVLGDTVARFSRCGTELYVNTSASREDQLWAIGEAVDHLRGLPAPGAQPVRPLRWSRSAVILPYWSAGRPAPRDGHPNGLGVHPGIHPDGP